MKLNRPTLALALLSVAITAPAQAFLHPEIDAFRSGDKAYVIAPPRPVAAFDYIENIQPAPDGAEWMLVHHRARRAQDAAIQITAEEAVRPTETSLFHPGRNMVRPLPDAIPPGQYQLLSGLGDVVVLHVNPTFRGRLEESFTCALDVPTGRMVKLTDDQDVRVVDSNLLLSLREGKLSLINWSGERRPLPIAITPMSVINSGEPGKFFLGSTGATRIITWHLLDVHTGQLEPAEINAVVRAHNFRGERPGLKYMSEPDRPDAHSAWFANPDGKDFLDFDSPTLVWGLPDGRLPHELDSRALIAGDLLQVRYLVPAGYSPGASGKLGAAWYIRDRMMFLRSVEEMTLAEYAKYIARFAQNRAMAMAKQAGVAFNIFSADHEDRLPVNAGWREAIGPYLKNNSILGRVTYLGDGQRMSELQDLQGVMGFIDTPYGRANISYDSSVRWVPKETP